MWADLRAATPSGHRARETPVGRPHRRTRDGLETGVSWNEARVLPCPEACRPLGRSEIRSRGHCLTLGRLLPIVEEPIGLTSKPDWR